MLLLSSADFFQNFIFFKKSFRSTIRVSNSLNQDQDQRSVSPDLVPNCLQRTKVMASKERDKTSFFKHASVTIWWGLHG